MPFALPEISIKVKVAVGIALWAFLAKYLDHDDLAHGHIPSSDRGPSEHWAYIWRRREKFVRDYTRLAAQDTGRWLERGTTAQDYIEDGGEMHDAMRGGKYGHNPEELDPWGKTTATTRCTATNYAITTYFCGNAVADNQDKLDLRSIGALIACLCLRGLIRGRGVVPHSNAVLEIPAGHVLPHKL